MMPVEKQLADFFETLSPNTPVFIAYSGGVDSHVLLHAAAKFSNTFKLQAIHINHHLHDESNDWAAHCQKVCDALAMTLKTQSVNITLKPGDSLEAVARQQRYAAIQTFLSNESYVLTAHHENDQAETVLLQLMRGAGIKGLSAMPIVNTLGKHKLARPLLHCSRQELMQYANEHKLKWIHDHSNADLQFDRNFVRQKILPLLETRRANITRSIARTATHCSEANELLDVLAKEDLHKVISTDNAQQLSAKKLRALSTAQQKNVLRYYIQQQQCLLPSTIKLSHILSDVLYSRHEAKPLVQWQNTAIRRIKDHIFLEIKS